LDQEHWGVFDTIDRNALCEEMLNFVGLEPLNLKKKISRLRLIRFLEAKGVKEIEGTPLEECCAFQLLKIAREWNERISDNSNKTGVAKNQDMSQRLEDLIELKKAGKEVHLDQTLKKKIISLENDHGLFTAKT